MTYIEDFKKEASAARDILLPIQGVEERFCVFSAEPGVPPKRMGAPNQAMGKFQMEQALGDWAEARVAEAINRSDDYKAIPFGDNDKTLSQEDSFRSLYIAAKLRELEFGKKADLLLFKKSVPTPPDASAVHGTDAEQLCATAEAALEVRSSRTSAHVFFAYSAERKAKQRTELSYTVKIEDLGKVYRWVVRNGKPVIYVQVFFDSIYALNFIDVFRYVNAQGDDLTLENPGRSGKYTIMIPLSRGSLVGSVEKPDFRIIQRMHNNGRHDIYPEPFGGNATVDMQKLLAVV